MTVMMEIYRAVFDRDDAGVRDVIVEIQTVAREYSATYTDPPRPMTDKTLDDTINSVLDLNIGLTTEQRSAVVNLLVNYHDLRNIAPWDDAETMVAVSRQKVLLW